LARRPPRQWHPRRLGLEGEDEEGQLNMKNWEEEAEGGRLISGVPRRSGRPTEDHEAAATSTEREGREKRARGRVTGGRRLGGTRKIELNR
jgi:hypothetical protein